MSIFIISMLGFDLRRVSQLRRFGGEFLDLGGLGSGGFAQVRKVRCLLDQCEYAAKLVRIKPSQCAEEAEERFFRQLSQPRAHSDLSHPNILRYHGCWVELEAFSEQERAEMQEQEQQLQAEFEMVVLGDSSSSDGIVFGSASSDPPPLQQAPSRREARKIGDGSSLSDYKEVRVYLLSELGEMDLSAFLNKRSKDRKERQLSVGEMIQIYEMALDMLAGLNYLHSKRIIHRDIKLHNVILASDGRCKLIDFGLAKKVKHWKTSIEQHSTLQAEMDEERFSSEIGTKLFSSPEQASSEKYDYRTDIYSLAVVLVLMFHSYTTSHEQRELLEKVRKRSLEQMPIPQPLKLLLFKCLGSQSERPSLGELKKCIKDLMRELTLRTRNILKGESRCSIEKQSEQVEIKGSMVEVRES